MFVSLSQRHSYTCILSLGIRFRAWEREKKRAKFLNENYFCSSKAIKNATRQQQHKKNCRTRCHFLDSASFFVCLFVWYCCNLIYFQQIARCSKCSQGTILRVFYLFESQTESDWILWSFFLFYKKKLNNSVLAMCSKLARAEMFLADFLGYW